MFSCFDCTDTIIDGGYEVSAHEHVVIQQSPPMDFHWTVARPPIVFGMVVPLLELGRLATPTLECDLDSVEQMPVHVGNLSAQIAKPGLSPLQNDSSISGPLLSEIQPSSSPLL